MAEFCDDDELDALKGKLSWQPGADSDRFLSVFMDQNDVYPCIAWSRPPIGNFASNTFEQIWNGQALEEIRAEFKALRPGVDCLHCTIRLLSQTGEARPAN